MSIRITDNNWASKSLELWAAANWTRYCDHTHVRDLIRAQVFSEWCERLFVLNNVPAHIGLPLIDIARLSFLEIEPKKLLPYHPLKSVVKGHGARTLDDAAFALANNTEWNKAVPSILRLCRGLAEIETAPSANGLPPLWSRVSLSVGERIEITPILRPDEEHLLTDIAALIETSDCGVALATDILSPLLNLPFGGQVAVFAHFDPHGLTSIAPTARTLRSEGFAYRIVASYESTGDYARLWKKIVQSTYNDPDVSAIVLLDLSIDSRHPERCREFADEANRGNKPVIWIDHHRDTLIAARNLAGSMVRVHLTGVFGTNLSRFITDREVEFLAVGALSDKDAYGMWAIDEWRKAGKLKRLDNILSGFERSLDLITPPGKAVRKAVKEYRFDPFVTVRERIVREDIGFFDKLGTLSNTRTLSLADICDVHDNDAFDIPGFGEEWNSPGRKSAFDAGEESTDAFGKWELRERVVIFTERPNVAGRFWYDYLERAMGLCGTDAYGRLKAPYAVACRELEGGKMNLLFLTHHSSRNVPDVRLFLPQNLQDKWIGHPRAFWLDMEIGAEKRLIPLMVGRINRFMGSVFPLS